MLCFHNRWIWYLSVILCGTVEYKQIIIYPSLQPLYISIHYYVLLHVSATRGHHQIIYVYLITTFSLPYFPYIGHCLQHWGKGDVLLFWCYYFIYFLLIHTGTTIWYRKVKKKEDEIKAMQNELGMQSLKRFCLCKIWVLSFININKQYYLVFTCKILKHKKW
jgi:hypothetical protein